MDKYAEVLITLLPTVDGGRERPIDISTDADPSYRPHLRVRGGNGEYLGVEFVDGPDGPLEPGDRTYATVRTLYAGVNYDALIAGCEFDIMEGGKVIGSGTLIRI